MSKLIIAVVIFGATFFTTAQTNKKIDSTGSIQSFVNLF